MALLCIPLLIRPAPAASRLGRPLLRVFTAEDYAGSPINSHVVVHPDGFVYVANSLKVLEFDGEAWRQIPQRYLSHTSVLVPDAAGRIWTSVRGTLSQLVPDAAGSLQFVSRQDRLPSAEREMGELLGGVGTTDGVYLYSARRLFRLGPDSAVQVWPAATKFESIFWMDGALHVAQAGKGLFRVRGGELLPWADTKTPLPRIFAARSPGPGRARVLLTERGPFLWDGPGAELRPFAGETMAMFADRPALHAIFLSDGRMAFGTAKEGLLVFDESGRLALRLAKADGLPSDRVNELAEDAEGGLWLAQQAGIARVQLDCPFRYHDGIDGSIRQVARHAGRLYVAHGEGVSVWDEKRGEFRLLEGLPDDTPGALTFTRWDSRLLVNASGVREVTPDGQLRLVAAQSLYALHRFKPDPTWWLGLQRNAGGRALWIFASQGETWRTIGKVAGVAEPERFGFDSGDGFFWGTDIEDRVWRADFRKGLRVDAPVETFELPPVRPLNGERYLPVVFPFAGGVEAARDGRLYRFDRAAGRFVPEDRIDGLPSGLGFNFPEAEKSGRYWFHYGGVGDSGREQQYNVGDPARSRLFRIVPDRVGHWHAEEFPAGPIGPLPINRLSYDAEAHRLWICSTLGLFSADPDWRPKHERPAVRVCIREVRTAAGRRVFGGAVEAQQWPASPLGPEERGLRVDFAAPVHTADFRGRTATVYRTRMEGLETGWTEWSAQSFREFTNLPRGRLVFQVQARDLDGRESAPVAFAVEILRPWWLTPWAYGGYGLVGVAGLAGAIGLRTRALRRKNLRLEAIVAERTRDLSRQNEELTRLHRLELDEKISARLGEEKARLEMLRYQLNPHFLFNALASIRGEIPVALESARATLDRLADFCRLTLHDRRREEQVTVGEEVATLRAFLDIEQARLGDFLQVEVDVAPAVESELLPRLLLLPLVENALKFGQVSSGDGLRLKIAIGRAGDRLVCDVANTGEWIARPAVHGLSSFGIGHENIRGRLARLYPAAHSFTHAAAEGWVRVRIELWSAVPRPEVPRSDA